MKSCSDATRIEFLAGLSPQQSEVFLKDWLFWARPEQLPPEGDWCTWLFLGGRGAGKTRSGAEWVRAMATGKVPFASVPISPIALVGETLADVREVMIEGPSGLLAVHSADERPTYEPSRRRLIWPNGSIAYAFSSEVPDSLRGPQFAASWADEIAKWKYARETWDMLQFGLRLGASPKLFATTTPKPTALIKQLLADAGVRVSHAPTSANLANLAPSFVEQMSSRYGGTRLGRQELDGELVDDREDGLWTRTILDQMRVRETQFLKRIVVAVDPPVTAKANSDACGIIVAGQASDGNFFVLADESMARATPMAWANKAIAVYQRFDADCLVAEVNQGGDLVTTLFKEIAPDVPIKTVRATRGKWLRAEPIAALYEQRRVHHVGALPALEDEMCDFGPNGLSNNHSPDRLDALVWALTELALSSGGSPRVRNVDF